MFNIQSRNVNKAWAITKQLLPQIAVRVESRNGPALEAPEPVTTCFESPMERVLFDPIRDANPFFHFFEGLWMLAGRNDVAWITQFNQRFMSYSDDGVTFHAAYGYRWRNHFEMDGGAEDGFADQIQKAIACLRADPTSRRVYISMWDPRADLWSPDEVANIGILGVKGAAPKDLPCNTGIAFKIRGSRLHMTVFNRSNDVVWGCYGANCVHMSMLQEYMAAMIGVGVGPYHQVSDSWHAYLDVWNKQDLEPKPWYDPYSAGDCCPYYMVTHPESFDADLEKFMAFPEPGDVHELPEWVNPFFYEIAMPMFLAWKAYKNKRWDSAALRIVGMPDGNDWKLAAGLWLQRRRNMETK